MAGPPEHAPEEVVLPLQITMVGPPEHAPEEGVLPRQVILTGPEIFSSNMFFRTCLRRESVLST
jgi:hypothetical protein